MNTKIICAWCGMEIKDTKNDVGKNSHGICIECYEKAMNELEVERTKSLLERQINGNERHKPKPFSFVQR